LQDKVLVGFILAGGGRIWKMWKMNFFESRFKDFYPRLLPFIT